METSYPTDVARLRMHIHTHTQRKSLFSLLQVLLSTGSVLAESQFDWVYNNIKSEQWNAENSLWGTHISL